MQRKFRPVKMLKVAVLLSVFAVVVLRLSITYYVTTHNIRQTSHEFIRRCHHMAWGGISTSAGGASEIFTSKYRPTATLSLIRNWYKIEEKRGQITEWKETRLRFGLGSRLHADIAYDLKGSKKGTSKVSMRLIKENDEWRISDIKITP